MGFYRSYAEANAFLEKMKLMPFEDYDELFNIREIADAVRGAKLYTRLGWAGDFLTMVDKYFGATKLNADWTVAEKFITEAFSAFGGVRDDDYALYSADPIAYISKWAVEKDYWYEDGRALFRLLMVLFPQFVDRLEVLLGVKEESVRNYLKCRTGKAPQMTQIITKPVGEDLWEFFKQKCSNNPYIGTLIRTDVALERLLVGTNVGDVMDIYLLLSGHNMPDYAYGAVDVCLYVENKKLSFNYAYYTTVCFASEAHDYLNTQLREIITEKTGLTFISDEGSDDHLGAIFPYIRKLDARDCNEQNESVYSFARLESDVDAPVYISFTNSADMQFLRDGEEFKRLGRVAAEKVHSYIGLYGVVPDTYFSMVAGEPSQDYVDVSGYVSDLSKITILKYDRQATDAQAATSFLGNMGMATEIVMNARPVGAEACSFVKSELVHKAQIVEKWEPSTTASFRLKDVPDVHVLKIYANGDDFTEPSRFFVESETGRWYEYDYSDVKDEYLTSDEVEDFSIRGVADKGLFVGGLMFELGVMRPDGCFVEQGSSELIEDVAGRLELEVKFLSHDSCVGMQNDMRCLWTILTFLRDKGILFRELI